MEKKKRGQFIGKMRKNKSATSTNTSENVCWAKSTEDKTIETILTDNQLTPEDKKIKRNYEAIQENLNSIASAVHSYQYKLADKHRTIYELEEVFFFFIL